MLAKTESIQIRLFPQCHNSSCVLRTYLPIALVPVKEDAGTLAGIWLFMHSQGPRAVQCDVYALPVRHCMHQCECMDRIQIERHVFICVCNSGQYEPCWKLSMPIPNPKGSRSGRTLAFSEEQGGFFPDSRHVHAALQHASSTMIMIMMMKVMVLVRLLAIRDAMIEQNQSYTKHISASYRTSICTGEPARSGTEICTAPAISMFGWQGAGPPRRIFAGEG